MSEWKKYSDYENIFAAPGLGGEPKRLSIDGISHTDAACSTHNNKCYIVLSNKNWSGKDSWIKLFESKNGINWSLVKVIVNEPARPGADGYQYVTIVDKSGADNGIVGKSFYIYSFKDLLKTTTAGFRWTVDLTD